MTQQKLVLWIIILIVLGTQLFADPFHMSVKVFDDKDYNELCIVLEDNYYCQSVTMIQDVITAKTKGKSVKALKYQARKMQADDISCD